MKTAAVLFVALSTFLGLALSGPDVAHAQDHATSDAEDHVGEESHADESHSESQAGEHHDPYDLSAANASASQAKVEEIRGDLALATLVVFGLLMAILGKFAWGPIRDALDRREQRIADNISEAERSRDEARRLLEKHEVKLASTANEIRGLMDSARKEADLQRQRIIADAEQIATEQQQRAVREINAAKDSALEELARSSVDQAVGLAGQIVGQRLSADDHAQMIADAIKQIPSKN